MNLTTGYDINFIGDKRLQRKVAKCFTRQAGQALSIEESRDMVEFFRMNDGQTQPANN